MAAISYSPYTCLALRGFGGEMKQNMPVKGFKYKRGQLFTQFNLTHVCTRRPDRTVTPCAILFFSKYEPPVIQIPMNDLNLLLLLHHLILCIPPVSFLLEDQRASLPSQT